MRDAEVVSSVVAGDPVALAEAYDRYANPLYAYCWFMLNDPAEAADAVADTFLIAVWRVDRLRDPERLRAWLYAVARNECLRRLSAWQAPAALGVAAATTDVILDITEDAERTDLRTLLRSASSGLKPSEREVIVLQLQGLDLADIALVLGVSRDRARSLLSRAHDRLQVRLGALLAGRAGPGMIAAAGLAAVTAESTRLTGGAPASLRDHVLWMATTQDDGALAHQADLRSRARGFGRRGFPKPLPAPKRGWHRSRQARLAVSGVVAAAVVAFVVTLALTGDWLPAPAAGQHPASNAFAQAAPPAANATAAAPAATAAQGTPTPDPPASTKAAKAPSPSATRSSAHPTARHTATRPSATPSVQHSTAPSSTGTPGPPLTSPSVTPTATQTPPATPGTLAVSAGSLVLTPDDPTGTITLTAENGPVSWSIFSSGGTGQLTVSPAGGSLAQGHSVQVTVTAPQEPFRFTDELTVSPGGQTITVVYEAR